MYSILIVDDEKKEREGISRLLKRYHFNLKISQAAKVRRRSKSSKSMIMIFS